jgi:hypothetical protein
VGRRPDRAILFHFAFLDRLAVELVFNPFDDDAKVADRLRTSAVGDAIENGFEDPRPAVDTGQMM